MYLNREDEKQDMGEKKAEIYLLKKKKIEIQQCPQVTNMAAYMDRLGCHEMVRGCSAVLERKCWPIFLSGQKY